MTTAKQRIVLDEPMDLDEPKVEKAAGLTFAGALLIMKAAGGKLKRPSRAGTDWNEAAVVRDSRGRFAKKAGLVGALQRLYSDKPAAPIAAAPRRNPLRPGNVKDKSGTVQGMTTPKVTREVPTQVKDLKVGDRIKSYVDFIPEGKITRAPQRGQSGYDFDLQWGDGKPERQYASGDREYTVLTDAPEVPKVEAPPAAPKRLTGAQLAHRDGPLTSYGKRADVQAKMVALGLTEQEADDQLAELGIPSDVPDMSYTAISRAQEMARGEVEAHWRGQTPAIFAAMLGDGPKAITHKPTRQVLEGLKANGWEVTGVDSMMGHLSMTSPNGATMSLHLPHGSRDKPVFWGNQSQLTYKAANERAAAGSVMPEAPKVVEVDPYAERLVPAKDVKVGDEIQVLGGEWRRVGQIIPRKDGGFELYDGTDNWDARISTVSGPTEPNRLRTVRTPRPAEPTRQLPAPKVEAAEDVAMRDAQARQRDFDRARGIGTIARDIQEIESKGHAESLTMDELRERVQGLVGTGDLNRKDGGEKMADLRARLDEALDKSMTFGQLRHRLDELMASEGVTYGGRSGNTTAFDPKRMEPLAGAPAVGSRVRIERPALVQGDTVLERATVTIVPDAEHMATQMATAARLNPPSHKQKVNAVKDMTRAEFDALPAERQTEILNDLRAARDSGDTRTIPSNRTSMGTTIRGATAEHVMDASNAFMRFTRVIEPPRPKHVREMSADELREHAGKLGLYIPAGVTKRKAIERIEAAEKAAKAAADPEGAAKQAAAERAREISGYETALERARTMWGTDRKTWTARQQAEYAAMSRKLSKLKKEA